MVNNGWLSPTAQVEIDMTGTFCDHHWQLVVQGKMYIPVNIWEIQKHPLP